MASRIILILSVIILLRPDHVTSYKGILIGQIIAAS